MNQLFLYVFKGKISNIFKGLLILITIKYFENLIEFQLTFGVMTK